MGTKAHKIYFIRFRVKPNQKEVTFDMTLHVTGIIACKKMRTVFFWNRLLISQQFKNVE